MRQLTRQPLLKYWEGEDIVRTISNNWSIYDVGSPYPGTEEGPKGLAVRQLKGYASWVQTVDRKVKAAMLRNQHQQNRLISEKS